MHADLARITAARTGRCSSWDTSGRNADAWTLQPGETRVLADISGPGCITHIWMTQRNHYRECLLRITWDHAGSPSVLVPLGDFFGLGHGLVNSYQSLLFTASTRANNQFNQGCALNCYAPMPFREHALVELANESHEPHRQFFYVDYETRGAPADAETGYLHAEFRRENPFGGWGHEIRVNTPEANVANKGRTAWQNNYVILDTRGRGHYLGCNLSVTNFQGTWWGEGDDMIFIDGETWPPSYHGTGTEEIFGGGACPNREYAGPYTGFVAIQEQRGNTWRGQNSMYRWFVSEPIRFHKAIRWTIEHGHADNFENDYSSVAYWYQTEPHKAFPPLPEDRMPSGGIAGTTPAPSIPGLIEAEVLLDQAQRHGGDAVVVKPGAPFSAGNVALFRALDKGAWITFPVRLDAGGRVRISGYFARASDLGRFQLLVDGKPLGAETDFHNDEGGGGATHVVPTGEVVFGELDLPPGKHEVKFECTGKNARSTAHFLAVDGFSLKPAK